jgi:hypothetical protein
VQTLPSGCATGTTRSGSWQQQHHQQSMPQHTASNSRNSLSAGCSSWQGGLVGVWLLLELSWLVVAAAAAPSAQHVTARKLQRRQHSTARHSHNRSCGWAQQLVRRLAVACVRLESLTISLWACMALVAAAQHSMTARHQQHQQPQLPAVAAAAAAAPRHSTAQHGTYYVCHPGPVALQFTSYTHYSCSTTCCMGGFWLHC